MKLTQIKTAISTGSGDSAASTAEPVNIKWELTAVEETYTAINSYENNTKEYEGLTIKSQNGFIGADGVHLESADGCIAYTAPADGAMVIKAKATGNVGGIAYSLSSDLCDGEEVPGLTDKSEISGGTVLLSEGNTYYFYCSNGSMDITTMEFRSVGTPYEELRGKTIYAFGDSIVYGHKDADNAFINQVAKINSMTLSKYAINGAKVIVNSGKDIMDQVNKAPASKTAPDFILFDGYTNDAYGSPDTDLFNAYGRNINIMENIGTIQGIGATDFDTGTFCGAFEKIIYTIKNRWPNSKNAFVTIHKSAARDWNIQCRLRELSIKMCKAWNIDFIDIFHDATLDTRDDAQMQKYIQNAAGSHPIAEACKMFYVPYVTEKLIEMNRR